ncbi:hypothetical protein EVAR_6154_1 [Eumeta japonica]|uniref:Uncharacterized protein n=1 Tax=Eumeta variegata TaxID=151549 RepID=A0A4C1TGY9_EUMVA|nr:hypothetical protein EVAR_6154_1 [Eumeta japonica]
MTDQIRMRLPFVSLIGIHVVRDGGLVLHAIGVYPAFIVIVGVFFLLSCLIQRRFAIAASYPNAERASNHYIFEGVLMQRLHAGQAPVESSQPTIVVTNSVTTLGFYVL